MSYYISGTFKRLTLRRPFFIAKKTEKTAPAGECRKKGRRTMLEKIKEIVAERKEYCRARRILKDRDTVKVSNQRIARALIDGVEGSVMENHPRQDGYYRVYTEKGFCRIIAEV